MLFIAMNMSHLSFYKSFEPKTQRKDFFHKISKLGRNLFDTQEHLAVCECSGRFFYNYSKV